MFVSLHMTTARLTAYSDDTRIRDVRPVAVSRRVCQVCTFPSDHSASTRTVCESDILEPAAATQISCHASSPRRTVVDLRSSEAE